MLYLFEFVQLGDVRDAGQAHVDEAEQLQVGELLCDSLDLALAGAAVVQDQLLDLEEAGQRADRGYYRHTSVCSLAAAAAKLAEVSVAWSRSQNSLRSTARFSLPQPSRLHFHATI